MRAEDAYQIRKYEANFKVPQLIGKFRRLIQKGKTLF